MNARPNTAGNLARRKSAKKITMIRRWKKIIEKKPSLAKAVRQGQRVGADAIR